MKIFNKNLSISADLQCNLALYSWVRTCMETCCAKTNEIDSNYNSMMMIPQWKLYTIYSDTPIFSKLNVTQLFQNSLKIYLLCRGTKSEKLNLLLTLLIKKFFNKI